MRKISDYIFNIRPNKLAVYLVLGPMILFFLHTIVTIAFKTISGTTPENKITVSILLAILLWFLAVLIFLWLFWLRSIAFSVSEASLGLPRKYFSFAFILFIVYLTYNLCYTFIDHVQEDYRYIFYALNEFIGFGGLLIAYPLICHYSARAVMAKRSKKPATFLNAIPFTLLLIFGTVLGIPFLHNYFSTKPSTNNQIIIIYVIAFGLFILILIMGFLASITGLV